MLQTCFKTVFDFNAALAQGARTQADGYPLYFVMADGAPLSVAAACENAGLIRDAIIAGPNTGHDQWRAVAHAINWEDDDLRCAHTDEPIECAVSTD